MTRWLASLAIVAAGMAVAAPADARDWIIDDDAAFDLFRVGAMDGQETRRIPRMLRSPHRDERDRSRMIVLGAGDRVIFRRGVSYTGTLHLTRTGAGPVTITSIGEGSQPVINAEGGRAAITLYDSGQWTVSGLDLRNTDTPRTQGDDERAQTGLLLLASNTGRHRDIHVHDNIFRNIEGFSPNKDNGGVVALVVCPDTIRNDAFYCDPTDTPSAYDGLRIENNLFRDIDGVGVRTRSVWQVGDEDGDGILSTAELRDRDPGDRTAPRRVAARDVLVANNRIYNTGRNAITVGASDAPVIEHNTIGPNTSYGDTGNTIFTIGTDDARIRYNEAFGNRGRYPGEMDRGAIDADFHARRTYIEYNYSHDNDFAFAIMKKYNDGVYINHNVVVGDYVGLLYFGFPDEYKARDISIRNNTIVSSADGYQVTVTRPNEAGTVESRWPINTRFEDNLVVLTGEGGSWGWSPYASERRATSGNVVAGNLVYGLADPGPGATELSSPAQVLAGPIPGMGEAPSEIDFTDAARLSDLRTCAGSPAIGTGSASPPDGSNGTDFWSNAITSQNVGADGSSGVDC